ncbi:hypothetical protein ES707_08612 [subsurface metagenome]
MKVKAPVDDISAVYCQLHLPAKLHRGRTVIPVFRSRVKAQTTQLEFEAAEERELCLLRHLNVELDVVTQHAGIPRERAIDELHLDLGQPRERAFGVVTFQQHESRDACKREVKMIVAVIVDEAQADAVDREFEASSLAAQQILTR